MTSTNRHPDGALARLARFCFRRRRLVLLAWIVGVVAVSVVGFRYGADADNAYSAGASDSARAQTLIQNHFPREQGDPLTLAVKADRGIDDPEVRRRVERVVADLDASPVTGPVTSPYRDRDLVTPDRRIARTTVPLTTMDVPEAAVRSLVDTVRNASGDGLVMGLAGDQAEKAETPAQGPTEGIGVLAAAVILFVAFGSLVAMGLPIVTGVLAVVAGIALMNLAGHLVPAPDFTVLVAALIGLGVGIDYALFILTRYKDGLCDGADPETATVTAIATAGRAVLFAGTTVVVALLGLIAMGQPMMTGVAVGASVTVLVTMVAAVTLVPAFLGFAGHRIRGRRRADRGPRRGDGGPRRGGGGPRRGRRSPAERWAAAVQRRPLTAAVVAGAALLLLAAPAASMRLSLPDASVQPHDRTSYVAYEILSEGFGPGYGAPLIFATTLDAADLPPIVEAVGRTEGIAHVSPFRTSPDGRAALFVAYPDTGYQDQATVDLVHRLRDDVLPDRPVFVGGPNAAAIDFADEVGARLPVMVAVVIALSLVLLMALVRSVTIALQAAVMNLLSIGAAFGVLVAVVQWGWLGSALGFPTDMPITTWVPMMMFPLLFGLSMDYEVFLISRIKEEYGRTGDTRAAVAHGLARTAKVITAAAAIMIAVFATALLGPDVSVKQIGLGMAAAVLIDATVIRMVLVPAVMELCGRANWWWPGRRPTAPAVPAPAPAPARVIERTGA